MKMRRFSSMRILVTGSKGFVGSNLCEALKAIRDSKDCRKHYAVDRKSVV